MPGKKKASEKPKRKMKHTLSREEFTKKVAGSKWAGVPFPQGTKRRVFEIYAECNGNINKTRKKIKDEKILPDGRVPNLLTIQKWAVDGHWKVLKDVVNDGILNVLEMDDDPDIKDVIRDDVALTKFLLRMRSGIYAKMSEKDSPLQPKDSREALAVLKHIDETINPYRDRLRDAQDRREGASTSEEVPDNVRSVASYLVEKGVQPTDENIARELLRRKEAKEASSR